MRVEVEGKLRQAGRDKKNKKQKTENKNKNKQKSKTSSSKLWVRGTGKEIPSSEETGASR